MAEPLIEDQLHGHAPVLERLVELVRIRRWNALVLIALLDQRRRFGAIDIGDQDKRVPPPDSYELYQALKDRGVPVKLILYKGFGHPINKPKQQRSVMEENLRWFGHYIWNEPLPDDIH